MVNNNSGSDFTYRLNPDDSCDIICNVCFRTVMTGPCKESIKLARENHRCAEADLCHLKRGVPGQVA